MPKPSAAEQLRQLDSISSPYDPLADEETSRPQLPGSAFEPDTTLGEAGAELLKGTGQGVVRSSPILGGAIYGGRLGSMAAPYAGPAAPYLPAAGAVVGAILGGVTGKKLEDLYTQAFPITNKEDASIYRRGGEAFGDAISFAPGAFYMPIMQGQKVAQAIYDISGSQKAANIGSGITRFISGIGEAARKYPKTFLAGEAHGAVGSSMGAMTAEATYPGEPGPALAGEVIGGVVSPSRWLTNGVVSAVDALRVMKSTYSQDARATRAAEYLQRILEEGGENIPKLIERLQKNLNITDEKGIPISPTAGQKTGSLPLVMLEKMLAKQLPAYSAENLNQGKQALQAYSLLVKNMRKVGTPESLMEAATLERQVFEDLLNGTLDAANRRSAESIVKITKDTPEARAAIGSIVKHNTSMALNDARAYEKQLWTQAVDAMGRGKVEYIPKSKFKKAHVEEDGLQHYTHPDFPGRDFDDLDFNTRVLENGKRSPPSFFIRASMPVTVPSNTITTYLKEASQIPEKIRGQRIPEIVQTIMTDLGVDNTWLNHTRNVHLSGEGNMDSSIAGMLRMNASSPKGKDKYQKSVKELFDYRSQLLEIAREAAAAHDNNKARIASNLASSLMDDIEKSAVAVKNPAALAAYDEARNYTKALNDVFTRTFADVAGRGPGAVTKTGAEKLPPEILISRAFGSNADVTAMRMNELMEASRFIKTTYDDVVNRFGKNSPEAKQIEFYQKNQKNTPASTTDALARALRLAAADSIDITNGRLDSKKLQQFVYRNKGILDKLRVTPDLENAITAENALRGVTAKNSKLLDEARKQEAWAKLLQYDDPVRALSDVMSSKTPVKGIQGLVQLAQKGGPDAVQGLKSTIYDYAFEKAGGLDAFNPTVFYTTMFDSMAPGKPSIVNAMRTQGLMTAQEANNLKRLIFPMQRIEKAMGSKRMLEDEGESLQDMATTLGLRIMGSAAGRKIEDLMPGTGGASMVAASAGSKYLRDMVQKMPRIFVKQIIQEATQDPELMVQLLTRPKTQIERFRAARSLHSYLAAAGLNYATFDEKEPEEPRPTGPGAGQMLRALPPAPPTTGLPNLFGKPPGPGAPPAPKPGGAPGPQSGASFQSLFPFDSISPMLAARQQQPQPR